MSKKRKIILSQELNDQQGFQFHKHGLNLPTTGKKLKPKTTEPQIPQRSNSIQRALTGRRLSRLRDKTPTENITSIEHFSIRNTDSIKQSQAQSCHTEHPFNDQARLTEEIIKKVAQSIPNKRLQRSQFKKKKKQTNLKEIVSKQKVNNLKHKFIDKLKMNNSLAEPVYFQGFKDQEKDSIWKWQAFNTRPFVDKIMGFLNIVFVFWLIYLSTLDLVFNQLRSSSILKDFQIVSLFYFTLQIVYNSITVKSKGGKKLSTLEEILQEYLHSNLVVDIINFLIIILDISIRAQAMVFIRLFIITKIPQSLQKLEKLQVSFIKNYYNEQYWSLVKVVLFNFCFAHVIAICLTAMAKMNPSRNWHTQKNISHNWSSQYIWGYYWAVNIMLTVGFGDLSATTDEEALCLIFVEIFAVMCLAYNINWIGTLISNIRAQDLEKGRNFKTFKQLSDKYGLPSQLEWRISNYIEESVNIRKKFNLQEEKAFVQSLPLTMKKDYLKQSNKSIFQELPFFNNLVDRTLHNFAQKIQMSISHPQQHIRRIDDDFDLLILRQGEIGFTVKKGGCDFNDLVMDRIKINKQDRPFILGLQFLSRARPTYQTKSLEYSVIYSLSHDNLISILHQSQMDYYHYCFLRDKNRSTLDQFEILKCDICKNNSKHTKFTCPKLHFIPLHQMVIYKENHKQKFLKNKRVKDFQARITRNKINSLAFRLQMLELLDDLPYNERTKGKKNRINNPFIDQINKMRKIKDSIIEQEIQPAAEQKFIRNASEVIKKQIQRYLKPELYEDQVWSISSDKIKNYKEYFPEGNSCNLEMIYNVQDRRAVLKKQSEQKKKTLKIGSWNINEVCSSSDEECCDEVKKTRNSIKI